MLNKKTLSIAAVALTAAVTLPLAITGVIRANQVKEYKRECTPHIERTREALQGALAAERSFLRATDNILWDGRVDLSDVVYIDQLVESRADRQVYNDLVQDYYFGHDGETGFFRYCDDPAYDLDDEDRSYLAVDHLEDPEVLEVIRMYETHLDLKARSIEAQNRINSLVN